MEDSNKVVIKINYEGAAKTVKSYDQPHLVTEWHYKRIVIAVLLVLTFIVAPFYFFSKPAQLTKEEGREPVQLKQNKNIVKPTKKLVSKVIKKPVAVSIIDKPTQKIIQPNLVSKVKKVVKATDDKITRTLLTTGLNNKEPIDDINTAVIATKDKAAGLYYFTEIKDMKGQTLYHHWLWGDKLIYKRTINILGNRWRASTSKLIPFHRAGNWRVRLVNKAGIVLNEIKFKVVQD